MAIRKTNYAIAAGHRRTLEVAENILKEGGNAFDAAIAAYMAAFVTEPCMASAGGGAFALVGVKGKPVQMFDFFCQTPKSKNHISNPEYQPITVDFGETREVYYVGLGAVAVPGSIGGLFALHERYGTIPMTILAEQAIELAKNGVVIDAFQAIDIGLLKDIFKTTHRGQELFYKKDQALREGDVYYPSFLADFLDVLSREGRDFFYKGEIARKVVEDMRTKGGYLTMKDFEQYEVHIGDALRFEFGNAHVFTAGYPSLGGALMNIYLAHIAPGDSPIISFDHKVNAGITCDQLFKHPERISEALKKVNPSAQGVFHHPISTRGTSHISIMDGSGNAIGLTFTIGEGSGYFIPGTDIHLNNMLGEPSLVPEGPHSWPEDVRLMSMMCPTLVHSTEIGHVALGSGGASRIPYMIAQVIEHLMHGKSLEEAIRGPRVHAEHEVIHIEPGLDWLQTKNEWRGYTIKRWEQSSLFFGGVHAVMKKQGRLEAVGDYRRHGVGRVVN